jgi:hypothetical protein
MRDRLGAACRQATADATTPGVLVTQRGRARQAKLITERHAGFGRVPHDLGVPPP